MFSVLIPVNFYPHLPTDPIPDSRETYALKAKSLSVVYISPIHSISEKARSLKNR
jgi:hypothetical protein